MVSPALEHIGGGLYVAENSLLSRLDLGSELASVGSIFVALNPRLVDLVIPPSLGQIEGDLNVAENTGLAKITSSGLSKIGGDFLLEENSALLTADFPRAHVRGWCADDLRQPDVGVDGRAPGARAGREPVHDPPK
jgi:hypothetical protein